MPKKQIVMPKSLEVTITLDEKLLVYLWPFAQVMKRTVAEEVLRELDQVYHIHRLKPGQTQAQLDADIAEREKLDREWEDGLDSMSVADRRYMRKEERAMIAERLARFARKAQAARA